MPRSDKSNKRSPDYDRAYDPTVPDADLTAAEYLRRQSERAKAAMVGAAGVLKTTAMQKVKQAAPSLGGGKGDGTASGENGKSDPLKIVKQYPWYSVGAATTAGFLGALYLNPSRFGRLKGRLKKLEKRLEEQESKLSGAPARAGSTHAETAAKSSIASSLGTLVVTQAMNALKPLLTQYIAPHMAGQAPPEEYGQEGYPPGAAYAAPPGYGAAPASPEARAAMNERYGGNPPPRAAGDPSI